MRLKLDDPDDVMPGSMRVEVEQFANRMFDYAVLTGTTPWGPASRTRPDLSGPGKQFAESVEDLRSQLADASSDVRRQTVYSILLREILPELTSVLGLHGLSVDAFAALGVEPKYEGYIRFLESLPSVRVNAHLYLQGLQNPQLPARENDLNDWYYVGTAVAHADVVVTEKLLAHIVNTGQLQKRAAVIADLADLPGV